MKSTIQISDDALNDLKQGTRWYDEQRKDLGEEFLNEFEISVQIIEKNPRIYPEIYQKVRRALLNRFPYLILYVINKSNIVIFAVFHTSRNPEIWKERVK